MAALGGDQERRAAAIVGELRIGTARQQQSHGREAVRLGHVVGMAGRPHEGGQAVRMAEIDGGPGIEQAAHDRRVAARRGVDERRLAGRIERDRIGPVFQQQCHERLRTVEGRGAQGRDAAAAGLIGRHSTFEKQPDQGWSIGLDGEEQGGAPGQVADGRVDPAIQQQPRDLDPPGARGFEERRLAGAVAHVDRCAGIEQALGQLETTAVGREGERLRELARVRRDELGEFDLVLSATLGARGRRTAEKSEPQSDEHEEAVAGSRLVAAAALVAEMGWPEREARLMLAISAREGRRSMRRQFVLLALLAGFAPDPLAAAGTGLRIVANEKSSTLTILDKDDKVIASVPSCGRPRGMIFTPDRKQFLVGCADDNVIGVYDVASLKLVRRITNVAAPETFDLHPDGRHLYVSNEEDAQATVFDLETGEPVAAFDTGEEPEGVLATPDGKLVFVASEAANLVHVIDVEKQEVVKDIVTDTRPRRFALTPDGKELWVSAEIAGVVNIIDLATLEVAATIEFLPKGMRREMVTPVDLLITRDGKRAYVALGRANHVAVVDVPTRKVLDYILVGRRAWGLRLTRDESLLYVANGLSDDITVVDPASLKPLRSIPVGEVPYGILIDD